MSKDRENWIDSIKVISCILVVLGHFIPSLLPGGIIPDLKCLRWFVDVVYYFHVPLFFICSGYLYQKRSVVNSFATWKDHVIKKGISLGVPYITFSVASWVLKAVFSGSVNTQNQPLLETLLVHPAAPFWYMYALFFLFAVTPTFSKKRTTMLGLFVSLCLKLFVIFVGGTKIYAVSYILTYEIWFVIGMNLYKFDVMERFCTHRQLYVGLILLGAFLGASVLIFQFAGSSEFLSFLMGLLGCTSTVIITFCLCRENKSGRIMSFLSRYTMPIYLMHTMCAAGVRSLLMKLGTENSAVHVTLGLLISFAGPIVAAELMKRLRLDFLLYPIKYIKLSKHSEVKVDA